MTSATAVSNQVNSGISPTTIDTLAAEIERLRQRLSSKEAIRSRELRVLWNERLRPFWRLHLELYRSLARRFLEHGDNYLAAEVAEEAAVIFGADVPLILTHTLAIARSGAPQVAQELLTRHSAVLAGAEEATSLLARTFKDLWKASGERHYLQEAFDRYYLDYTTTRGDRTFPGVNAASMALFLGEAVQARQIAGEVLELLRARSDSSNYWDQVTMAECLLVAGEFETARSTYHAAGHAGGIAHAHLATTRAQARLLLRQHGRAENEFDECFPLPRVLAFSGHRIDEPGRTPPRFPESLAPAVKERIRRAVAESKAGFGYAAAANGADILFLEVMQEAGLDTYIHLPMPEANFIRQSVEGAGFEWLERYRKVIAQATEITLSEEEGPVAFEYGNRLLLGAASQHARQLGSEVALLTVWDGGPGSGPGSTADFVRLARASGHHVEVIPLGSSTSLPSNSTGLAEVGVPASIISVLSVSVPASIEDSMERLARLLGSTEILHRDIAGNRVRLFFGDAATAARTGLDVAGQLAVSVGLHTGPVELAINPVTAQREARGIHAGKADAFSTLEPMGTTYASAAFAALMGLEPDARERCEFVGYRPIRSGAMREPVFRLVRA